MAKRRKNTVDTEGKNGAFSPKFNCENSSLAVTGTKKFGAGQKDKTLFLRLFFVASHLYIFEKPLTCTGIQSGIPESLVINLDTTIKMT
jgi:hypothetical protein